MISVDNALSLLSAHSFALQAENVPLAQSAGRRLAQPLVARITQPPATVSAMDGYAVKLKDVSAPNARLVVIGTAPAGTPFDGEVQTGEAVRIFTGGHLPAGADHVIMQEATVRDGNFVTCLKAYDAPEFIRMAGIDFSQDETLIEAGTILSPIALALAGAANHAIVSVCRRFRVGILANGDELRPPGSNLLPGQIVNANAAGLGALVSAWGGEPIDLGIAADNVESILEYAQSTDIDLFLPVGGASVGDHDHMRVAFARAGFKPVFEKIAVKPGKPTWFSRKADQRVLGLPGNPASAFVCAHLFLKPLLTGETGLNTLPAKLLVPLPSNGDREQFLRARIDLSEDGNLVAQPAGNQDSSLLKPFLSANGLIRRQAFAEAEPEGARVAVMLIGSL